MSETNKVVLAAILGIIIGFGFGRFSISRERAAPYSATSTPTESTSGLETSSSGAPAVESPAEASPASDGSSDTTLPGTSGAAVATAVATKVFQQTSNTSAVSALNQKAGLSVMALVSFDRQGWVAVHEQTNGKAGRILGAKHYGPATGNLTIPLKRATVAGRDYYVMLHSDDGDINDFSLTRDLPLLGANGLPIMVMFRAQ